MIQKNELRQLVKYWQNLLRLRDWQIDAEFKEELTTDDRVAEPIMLLERKEVTIHLLKDLEAWNDDSHLIIKKGKKAILREMIEPAILHEILHCHVGWYIDLEEDELARIQNEQAIEFITDALLKLKYGA